MDNNNDRFVYKCLNCGQFVLKSRQFLHDIKCQAETKLNKVKDYYICPECREAIDIKDKITHLINHGPAGLTILINDDRQNIISNRNNNNYNIPNINHNNRRNSMDYRTGNNFNVSSDSDSSSDNQTNKSEDNNNEPNYIISKIKNPKTLSDNKKKCLICLEKFKKGEDSIILTCLHIFHSSCIKKWMKIKNFCPLCKIKINNSKK